MPLVLTNRRRRGGSASAPAFSPTALYSSGAQGIWLDPSDLTTMFSDRAGTTPVTAPGTVVGLRLDKSKGLVLGAELVTNGGFDSGITGWTKGVGTTNPISWDSVGQRIIVTNDLAYYASAAQTISGLVVGKSYKVSAAVSNNTVLAKVAIATVESNVSPGGGIASCVFTATATSHLMNLANNNNVLGGVAYWDNISVRELAGNHATAPTDAARPTYGVEPKGGRRNLLTWSEDQTNNAWTKANVTIPTTQYLAPDGTTTAELMYPTSSGTNRFSYQVLTSASNIYTGSVYAKAAGKNFLCLDISGGGASAYFDLSAGTVGTVSSGYTASIQSVGSGWHRCSIRNTSNAVLSFAGVYGVTDADNSRTVTANGTDGILLWGAQLELGSTATAYQRVLSAYDITESGVATCHYVQYDGSDDSMSTSAIDFTATDKMSVFAGVRKLSDATIGILIEQSVQASGQPRAFFLAAPVGTSASERYGFLSHGDAPAVGGHTAFMSTGTNPDAAVLTAIGDISADLNIIRRNGTAGTSATADQGTGNFGNYPLFIGRRNNATLPFTGRDYGLIVVGKAASSGEITDTETWLAAKTSGVTL